MNAASLSSSQLRVPASRNQILCRGLGKLGIVLVLAFVGAGVRAEDTEKPIRVDRNRAARAAQARAASQPVSVPQPVRETTPREPSQPTPQAAPRVAATGAVGPLKSATVIGMYNEVEISKGGTATRPAQLADTLVGRDALRTGKQSKAELEFADKSLARLGSNTIFSFDPSSRDMHLQQGKALICVPPGGNGARIASPSATAAVLGDVVAMRVGEGGVTQIVVLSQDERGPVQVTLHKTGETRTLQAGQMLTLDPAAPRMPAVVEISVEVFLQSSGLVKTEGGFKNKLPETAQKEMTAAKQWQAKELERSDLQGASLAAGDKFVIDNYAVQAATARLWAGTYRVSSLDGKNTGFMVIRDDGNITGGGTDNSDGRTMNFAGNMTSQGAMTLSGSTSQGRSFSASVNTSGGTSGSFTASGMASGSIGTGTGTESGTYTLGATSLSGNYTSGIGHSGTFTATRTQ